MKFKSLTITNWKQFDNLDIIFHPKLTVLTGANGSGKTTILNLLAQHFNWNWQELSTPAKDKQSGIIRFFNRFFKRPVETADNKIGYVKYDDGKVAALEIPNSDSPQYMVSIQNRGGIAGLNIPSHRPVFNYRPVSTLTTRKRQKQDAFRLVSDSIRSIVLGSGGGEPGIYHIKETLLTWAIYGYGNKDNLGETIVESDREQIEYYEGFQHVLRKILPDSLGFEKFAIRSSEIVLVTRSGDFMIDAASGGISTLIDLAWQIYMFSTKENKEFTVLIDEMENHLHATMQRAILQDLLNAFPGVQFIVSTHSPLIVGSVKDSSVYVLKYNSKNKVDSLELDLVNKAKTATEILREVLGVPFTMPIWVESQLEQIAQKYSKTEINRSTLTDMRKELTEIGLESLVPETISRLVDKEQEHDQT